MKNKLIFIGITSSLLWAGVTAMSFGLPRSICQFLDKITFLKFSRSIFQMENGFYYQVNNNDMPTVIFLCVFAILFALMFTAFKMIESRKNQNGTLGVIIVFSVLFRLILLPGEPIHENDFYRYLWDGKSAIHGINPFKYAPADLFMYEKGLSIDFYDSYNDVMIKGKAFDRQDVFRLDTLISLRDQNPLFYERIGHWQVPTIYPPVAQMVFAGIQFLQQDSSVFMKFIFVLFDLGVLYIIILLLRHFNKNSCMVLLYGWSPLVLKEFPNAGHYDPIVIFFTMLAVYWLVRKKTDLGFFSLSLAVLSKFFSAVLLPFFLKPFKGRAMFIFIATIGIFYLPFIFWDNTGLGGIFQGLHTYNKEWSYNSSVFAIVYVILEKLSPELTKTYLLPKAVVGCLYLIFLGCLFRLKTNNDLQLFHKCFFAIAILFLINPVGDPWYFCWAVPFLCFFPYRSWILLSGLLMLSYLNFHTDIDWVNLRILNIPSVSWLIYVPFFAALIFEATCGIQFCKREK